VYRLANATTQCGCDVDVQAFMCPCNIDGGTGCLPGATANAAIAMRAGDTTFVVTSDEVITVSGGYSASLTATASVSTSNFGPFAVSRELGTGELSSSVYLWRISIPGGGSLLIYTQAMSSSDGSDLRTLPPCCTFASEDSERALVGGSAKWGGPQRVALAATLHCRWWVWPVRSGMQRTCSAAVHGLPNGPQMCTSVRDRRRVHVFAADQPGKYMRSAVEHPKLECCLHRRVTVRSSNLRDRDGENGISRLQLGQLQQRGFRGFVRRSMSSGLSKRHVLQPRHGLRELFLLGLVQLLG
jgi:hypothetical protein